MTRNGFKNLTASLFVQFVVVMATMVPDEVWAARPPCSSEGQDCKSDQSCCTRTCAKQRRAKVGICCAPTGTDNNCDGRDDDCDGIADDNYVVMLTGCGVGACAQIGSLNCVAGSLQDTCVPGSAGTEECDGIDNDCDGVVDDGLGQTTCGTGDCARTIDNCLNGVPQTCSPEPDGSPCDDGQTNTSGDRCVEGACVGGVCPEDCLSALDHALSLFGPYNVSLECGYDGAREAGSVYLSAAPGSCDLNSTIEVRDGRCFVEDGKSGPYHSQLLTNDEQAACAPYAAQIVETICGEGEIPPVDRCPGTTGTRDVSAP